MPRRLWFRLVDLDKPAALYYMVAVMAVIGFLALWRVVNSPFGNILKAIRENEPRAISLGYRVQRYKLAAFVISAAMAGLAGGLKAIVFQLATLNDVAWTLSGEVVLMTLVGGIGTLFGPVVGASLIISLESHLAAMILMINDVHSLGLKAAQGTYLTTASYWDMNAKTRAWSNAFMKKTGAMPSMLQAGVYGAVLHYLKAVKAAGTDDADKVAAAMRAMPINDVFTENARIREDGRVLRDM